MIFAAFIAAMGIFTSVNAQDIKKDKKNTPTESCCNRKSNCNKNEKECTPNKECTGKKECCSNKGDKKGTQKQACSKEACCDKSGICKKSNGKCTCPVPANKDKSKK